MPISAKSRIALNALLDIIEAESEEPIAIPVLAGHQDLSNSYLEQIFFSLRKADIVSSVRGPGGGYQITRPLNTITLAEVARAVDDRLDQTNCAGNRNCFRGEQCHAHNILEVLASHMDSYMDTISLADVVTLNRHHDKQSKSGEERWVPMNLRAAPESVVRTRPRGRKSKS